jgi:DMSO/TMAO reductase YedYZ molybdopterin-dependent catalytic subunit
MKIKQVSEKNVSRRTWISFSVFSVSSLLAWGGWKWLRNHAQEPAAATAGLSAPVRDVLNENAKISSKIFSPDRLVKTYPLSMAAKKVRVNGSIGLMSDMEEWQLKVIRKNGQVMPVSLKDIMQLPRQDIVYDFKCIEGWDQVSHWGGVKCSDFMEHYGLHDEAKMEYLSLVTPDEKYYVGIDMPSVLHPQTLLCYEVNGSPLPVQHGAPLRLIIPVKYGVKHLKRIGTMAFANERPPDYWAERGYDYYSGL